MTRVFLTALLAGTLAGGLTAAAQSSQGSEKAPPAPKTLTLTGCVEKADTPNHYTIADEVNGKYDVSGSDIRKYLGMRVEAAGVPGSTKVVVKGGLWPTPNVAAGSAGTDPAKRAVAAMPGGGASGTGDVSLPTLKVRNVRTLDGACK
jgi:hypothetical protein